MEKLVKSPYLGELMFWRIFDIWNHCALSQQVAAEKKAFCEVVRECTRVRPRIEMFQLLEQ